MNETIVGIVKRWNAVFSTKFRCGSDDKKCPLYLKLSSYFDKYGEEKVMKYFDELLNKSDTDGNVWKYVDTWVIDKWMKEQTEEKAQEKPQEVSPEVSSSNVLSILGKEIVSLMGKELAEKINTEVENRISEFVADKTLVKVVEYKGEQRKVEGITHEQFGTILKFVSMDEPVILTGPAGTGKNVIAKQVAEALGLDFYFSNAVTQEYKITGYGDANGNYVKTQFYDAFTKGGLFLLDEIDASCPEALIVLNCAIANRYFDFPVIGRVEAHPNFRVIANANTFGTGASMEYVGRNQLDGATLNRFALVEVNYDRRIEDNVCPDSDIADFCRAFREVCNKNGVHHIVSYREMSRLYKMIDIAGMDKTTALKTCLIKGLERDSLVMICGQLSDNLKLKENLKNILNNH